MSRWFRLDDDVINDPKILLLPEAMRWIWVAFLCIASKNDGSLPAMEIIALSLRVKVAKAVEYLARLVDAGLIDKTETGFAPHNWAGRQYRSDVTDPTAASRQKAYRERNKNRNGERNAAVTNTDTREQIQITEAEKKKETREIALDDGWPADCREQFWQAFPNKVGKPKALAKLDACRKRGIVFADVMAGLRRYVETKPPDRAWLNPETFLNQERWTDQPAAVAQQGNSDGRRTVQDAARDLHERVLALDEPPPELELRDGAGAGVVRLLPAR